MHKKVSFIGVGVQKSGTTWIHRILDEHPDVCVAHGKDKDTKFFGSYYDRGYEWYERHFDDCGSEKMIGEVSTSYFYDTDVALRIKQYNKDVKLFVCLRNPVERIISNHKHEARSGRITGDNLELGLALKNNPAYVMQSRYVSHLKNWYKHFNKEQLHIMLFDDLVSRPEILVRELYTFLGVDDEFTADLDKKDNVSRVPASIKAEKGIQALGKAIRTTGLGSLVDMGRKYGLNDWLRSKNTVKDAAGSFLIKDETIDELNELFRAEILELSEITGINLSHWLVSTNDT